MIKMLAPNQQAECKQCHQVFGDLDKYIKHVHETKHIGCMIIDQAIHIHSGINR